MTDSSSNKKSIEDAVQDSFHSLIGKTSIVTKFIVVAEVIDEDGDVSLNHMASRTLSLWDAVGMLECVVNDAKLTYAGIEEVGSD